MKKHVLWFAAATIILIIFGTIYSVVQQSQRADANYPQIQIAEDAAAALNQGAKPSILVSGHVSLNDSLAPFLVIYSRSGKIVAGSGYLNGHVPGVPIGILSDSNDKPYNAVTWQPQKNVRIAVVTYSANKYYVLSGRSLKYIEANENKSFALSYLGGFASIFVLILAFGINKKKS
jgi:hypothetical protein